jgi:hypothetical protein
LGSEGDAVAHWTTERKLIEAAKRATPMLPAELRGQFASLFTGANLAITGGVLSVWAASHALGVGAAVDVGLVVVGTVAVGWQVFEGGRDIGRFLVTAANAKSTNDLDRAACFLARAVITLGLVAFIGMIVKFASRLVRRGSFSAKDAAKGGEVVVPPANRRGPWWKARDFGEDFPGTSVPKGFIMETGGQQFRVTINACEHMAQYAGRTPSAGQLRNPGVWSTSPGNRIVQVDYPLSSLAGALEQAAKKYGGMPKQRFPLEKFGNWELGIDTRSAPWVVEHALPLSK